MPNDYMNAHHCATMTNGEDRERRSFTPNTHAKKHDQKWDSEQAFHLLRVPLLDQKQNKSLIRNYRVASTGTRVCVSRLRRRNATGVTLKSEE